MHNLNMHTYILAAFNKKYKRFERLVGRCNIIEYKDYGQYAHENKFKILASDGDTVASFNMTTLPGCCGTMVLSFRKLYVAKEKTKALVKLILLIQEAASKEAKFTQVLATCLNGPEYALYTGNGFKPIDDFTNVKTNNHVTMFVKHIEHEKSIGNFGAEA